METAIPSPGQYIGLFMVFLGVLAVLFMLTRKKSRVESEKDDGKDLLLNIKPYEEMAKEKEKAKSFESANVAAMRKFITTIKEQLEAQSTATIGIKDLPAIKRMLE